MRDCVAEGVVEWLGHVEDMGTLLASVDIVVLPSYREGLPKGLVEAAACGLPLVTTDVPGCREVVTGNGDGLRVPVRDSQALGHALTTLEENRSLVTRMVIEDSLICGCPMINPRDLAVRTCSK